MAEGKLVGGTLWGIPFRVDERVPRWFNGGILIFGRETPEQQEAILDQLAALPDPLGEAPRQ